MADALKSLETVRTLRAMATVCGVIERAHPQILGSEPIASFTISGALFFVFSIWVCWDFMDFDTTVFYAYKQQNEIRKQNTGKPIKSSFLICIQVWKTKSFQFSRKLLKTESIKRIFHSSIFLGKRKICQHLTHPICFRKNENNQCIPEVPPLQNDNIFFL
ncbi:hypothetical protein LXL04_020570 [Taraxacum kok-saghyz]